MGISCRMFLLDPDDDLYRLPSAKFNQMLRHPTSCRITRFAGARVRITDIALELLDRQPILVAWNMFGFLTFDNEGYFDAGTFDNHQRARAELALAPLVAEPRGATIVIDATTRFVDQGGSWKPSRTLQRHIDEASLGRVKCPRL